MIDYLLVSPRYCLAVIQGISVVAVSLNFNASLAGVIILPIMLQAWVHKALFPVISSFLFCLKAFPFSCKQFVCIHGYIWTR